MKVGAVQLEVALGDVARNLAESDRLVREAAGAGAELVVLPEFFSSGAAFDERVARSAMPPDGAATDLLSGLAKELGIHLGGSFLCRDPDGHVRNAFFLAGPDGSILGRHDKDLPTMWENALYVGGTDDGVIDAGPFTAGASVCWEFMRSQTARRLVGRVDVMIGGSNWWSVPQWPPLALTRRMEAANAATAQRAPAVFGRLVGAPVVHAANAGGFRCPMPEMPIVTYRGHFQGGAMIAAADGTILALRRREQGAGIVVAHVEIGRTAPLDPIPNRFWLHNRGALATWSWHAERIHGRRWYERNVRGHPTPVGSGPAPLGDQARSGAEGRAGANLSGTGPGTA